MSANHVHFSEPTCSQDRDRIITYDTTSKSSTGMFTCVQRIDSKGAWKVESHTLWGYSPTNRTNVTNDSFLTYLLRDDSELLFNSDWLSQSPILCNASGRPQRRLLVFSVSTARPNEQIGFSPYEGAGEPSRWSGQSLKSS